MASIEFRNVSHSYAPEDLPPGCTTSYVIEDLNLTWADGTANALLGPSGCGKTTGLNIISGLLRPTRGAILFDGRDVTALSPRDRHIAQVFQFPVVYDTMTVADNLAFPLRNAGMGGRDARKRAEAIAEILELTSVLGVTAGKLSQAEKQKVSLGRGIVRENTAAILLDEPLTVIDPKAKYALRRSLRQIQQALKITMIYVTHDQHEALTFADSVTVMKGGKVVQTGSPDDLHSEPASPFIGYFIGSPGMNLVECTRRGDVLDLGDFSIPVPGRAPPPGADADARLLVGIRPECLEVRLDAAEGWIPLRVGVVERLGVYRILNLVRESTRLKARVADDTAVAEGGQVWVRFPEQQLKLFRGEERVC